MAKNLQAKLSTRDTLRVYDIHTPAMKQFADEATTQRIGGAAIELAKTARDAANSAVRLACLSHVSHSSPELHPVDLRADMPAPSC